MENALNKIKVVAEKRLEKAGFSGVKKATSESITRPVVRFLAKTRVTPNQLTLMGFWLTAGGAALIISGHLFAAAFVVLGSSFFDMLDGALARGTNRVTKFGGVLDSTLDRVSEAILFLGIVVYFVLNASSRSTLTIILSGISLIASFLVSYVRARAEGSGLKCEVGVLTRAERVLVLVLGLSLSGIDYALTVALAIIAILASITAIQRLFHVWKQTRDNG